MHLTSCLLTFIPLLSQLSLAESLSNPQRRAPKPAPARGESGVHKDGTVTTIYYGNDMQDHAEHLRLHYIQFPAHDKAWPVLQDKDKKKEHRTVALRGVPPGKDVEAPDTVRDEKMNAFLDYEGPVTVMYCDNKESNYEGTMSTQAQGMAGHHGKVRLVDNRTRRSASPVPAKNIDTSSSGQRPKRPSKNQRRDLHLQIRSALAKLAALDLSERDAYTKSGFASTLYSRDAFVDYTDMHKFSKRDAHAEAEPDAHVYSLYARNAYPETYPEADDYGY